MQTFTRDALTCILIAALAASGCNGRGPTAPTGNSGQSSADAPLPSPPPEPVAPVTYDVTGVVTDDAGTPLPGAKIIFDFLTSSAPGTRYSETSAVAGASGAYGVTFTAVPRAMKGPAGTEAAFAFAGARVDCPSDSASGCAYDPDARYVLATERSAKQNFRLNRVIRITAGDSASLTLTPDAPICVNNVQDMHPWPSEFVCRSVRIVAPHDGLVTVEVTSTQSGAAPPIIELEVRGGSGPCCSERLGNPLSIAVVAGMELVANVELPWGSPPDGSIVLKTSMEGK